MSDNKLLKDYEIEIFGEDGMTTGPFTLEVLIEGHRRLRKLNQENQQHYLSDMAEAREIGKKQGYESVINGEYIKISTLKAMSVSDFINKFADFQG